MGRSEPSSRCHPPFEEGFEREPEQGHSAKGVRTQKGAVSVLTEDYKSAVRYAFEEVWNQSKVAVLDGLCAATYIYHDPFRPDVRTLEELKAYVTEVRSYFPDFHLTIEDLIVEGEQVVVRYTWRGTHTGDFGKSMPLPATGKQVTVTGIYIGRAVEGKAVEAWNVADNFGVLQELGLLPVPQPVG